MNKLISFFKKWQNVLKSILFLSISILVLLELVKMGKTISPEAVKSILSGLSPFQIVSLLVIGILSVSPMMLYDFILCKELDHQQLKQPDRLCRPCRRGTALQLFYGGG